MIGTKCSLSRLNNPERQRFGIFQLSSALEILGDLEHADQSVVMILSLHALPDFHHLENQLVCFRESLLFFVSRRQTRHSVYCLVVLVAKDAFSNG